MKNDKIVSAYDRAAPSVQTAAQIYENVLARAELPEEKPHSKLILRRVILAAACVAVLLALAVGGYAAYQKWSLPEPEQYENVGKWGYLDEHERNDYTTPSIPESQQTTDALPESTPAPAEESISDVAFMVKALEILKNAGMTHITPESMTVVRQADLRWDREEAEVSFIHDGLMTSVKFNAKTGELIGFYGFEYILDKGKPCKTQAEADALATACYASLPVAQGYKLRYVEKFDSNFWCYDFCREVLPDIFSEYECVRVAINPEKGMLTFCTVFDVPLLDDHQPGEEPITQQQAEQAAMANEQFNFEHRFDEGWTLTSAEVKVCMPNWAYSTGFDVALKASKVTRLCWLLAYEKDFDLYHAKYTVMVDYYTGEILGGDYFG